GGERGQPMAAQQAPHGLLGHADEAGIEELEDVGEGGTMPPVLGHDEVRRFVKHEKPVEIPPLDGDAVVGDVGEAADTRIIEAGDQSELGRHPAAERENLRYHKARVIDLQTPVTRGEGLEELVLEAADGGAKIA